MPTHQAYGMAISARTRAATSTQILSSPTPPTATSPSQLLPGHRRRHQRQHPGRCDHDLAGDPRRYNNGTVDMGAYEYQGAFVACCPTTVFVDSAATGANDGTSWADAYTDLQDAIDLVANSCPGVEIWVAKGTYFPSRDQTGNASPSDPRDKTFYINTDGTQLYGGFAGTETDKSQRVAGNETILSGDIGIAGDSTDNCYTVMYLDGSNSSTGISPNTRISGFTILEGNADGASSPFSERRGGGMFWMPKWHL
jgi:hypothetical protein